MTNNKYSQGRYQARMIEDWFMQGYYQVIDTEQNDRVVQSGFLGLNDAYAFAFEMNDREARQAAARQAIAHQGLDW